jgi:hypothetical protein
MRDTEDPIPSKPTTAGVRQTCFERSEKLGRLNYPSSSFLFFRVVFVAGFRGYRNLESVSFVAEVQNMPRWIPAKARLLSKGKV